MATRSMICVELPDNELVAAYVHYDGHPSTMLPRLERLAGTTVEAFDLIEPGDMSSVESDHDWNMKRRVPQPLYYKDRGEDAHAISFDSITDYVSYTKDTDCEYAYLFINNSWTYQKVSELNDDSFV